MLYINSVHTIVMALHSTVAGSNLLSEFRKCVSCCTRAAMYAEQYILHSNLETQTMDSEL